MFPWTQRREFLLEEGRPGRPTPASQLAARVPIPSSASHWSRNACQYLKSVSEFSLINDIYETGCYPIHQKRRKTFNAMNAKAAHATPVAQATRLCGSATRQPERKQTPPRSSACAGESVSVHKNPCLNFPLYSQYRQRRAPTYAQNVRYWASGENLCHQPKSGAGRDIASAKSQMAEVRSRMSDIRRQPPHSTLRPLSCKRPVYSSNNSINHFYNFYNHSNNANNSNNPKPFLFFSPMAKPGRGSGACCPNSAAPTANGRISKTQYECKCSPMFA